MSIADGAKALIEEDMLSGPALGIAQKIAATGDLAGLSAKQRAVYDGFIAPHFKIGCSTPECEFEIDAEWIGDAIRAEARGDSYFCQHCEHFHRQMAKDD
ncbi:hypothetical protein DF039_36955 [Burkholderia cenocepacia]|nr:hypothetical protein DF039_36955 [Burkholderia cenocepacia]